MRKKSIGVLLCLIGIAAVLLSACKGTMEEKKKDAEKIKTEQPGIYYYETSDEKKIYILQSVTEAVEALGQDYEYFEAPSCASDGLDMFYYYQNITLMANELDGEKVITDIYFKNDTVSTPEGIRINSEYADVVNQYGSDYVLNGTALEYTDQNTVLIVDIKDGKVASVEYKWK